MTPRTVCGVVWTVAWPFVLRAVSYIVFGAVSVVTARSPQSVVSQGIRSGVKRIAVGVICRFTRPALPHITRHVALSVIPPAIWKTARPDIPQVMSGVRHSVQHPASSATLSVEEEGKLLVEGTAAQSEMRLPKLSSIALRTTRQLAVAPAITSTPSFWYSTTLSAIVAADAAHLSSRFFTITMSRNRWS